MLKTGGGVGRYLHRHHDQRLALVSPSLMHGYLLVLIHNIFFANSAVSHLIICRLDYNEHVRIIKKQIFFKRLYLQCKDDKTFVNHNAPQVSSSLVHCLCPFNFTLLQNKITRIVIKHFRLSSWTIRP